MEVGRGGARPLERAPLATPHVVLGRLAGGHEAAIDVVASLDLDTEPLPERRTRLKFLDIQVGLGFGVCCTGVGVLQNQFTQGPPALQWRAS